MQTPRKDAVGRMVRMDERWVRFVLETGLRLDELRGINPKRHIIDGHVRVTGKFKGARCAADLASRYDPSPWQSGLRIRPSDCEHYDRSLHEEGRCVSHSALLSR
jgi:hypothetical protein